MTPDDVVWADPPARHEAGSPNVIGAIALAAACRELRELGMETIAAHERALSERLWSALAGVPGLRSLALWPDDADRVGVATFNLEGYRHPLLAAILSAEHAIGVRHGCFCAHPLLARLLGLADREVDRLAAELRAGRRPALPGAVRASLGLGTTLDDIDRLIDALHEIATDGPARGATCTRPASTSTNASKSIAEPGSTRASGMTRGYGRELFPRNSRRDPGLNGARPTPERSWAPGPGDECRGLAPSCALAVVRTGSSRASRPARRD